MRRFQTSLRVVLALAIGAAVLVGCGNKPAAPTAGAPAPDAQAAPAAAEQPSSGVKEGQAASQAVDQINGQTGATVDGIK